MSAAVLVRSFVPSCVPRRCTWSLRPNLARARKGGIIAAKDLFCRRLEQWGTQKVWRGAGPSEAAHPVELHYTGRRGERCTLAGGGGAPALLSSVSDKLLAGTTLVWTRGAQVR